MENTKKQPQASTKPYFDKQKSNKDATCRICAINNVLGRKALDETKFNRYCDQYDTKYQTFGSKLYFSVASTSDMTDNLLSFILRKFHIETIYIPPRSLRSDSDSESTDEETDSNIQSKEAVKNKVNSVEECFETCKERLENDTVSGFLCFSFDHVWAYRKIGNTWFCLDSLAPKPSTVKPLKILRDLDSTGYGYIFLLKPAEKRQTQISTITTSIQQLNLQP